MNFFKWSGRPNKFLFFPKQFLNQTKFFPRIYLNFPFLSGDTLSLIFLHKQVFSASYQNVLSRVFEFVKHNFQTVAYRMSLSAAYSKPIFLQKKFIFFQEFFCFFEIKYWAGLSNWPYTNVLIIILFKNCFLKEVVFWIMFLS